jgi:ketosteroid isomerase-like protein
MKKFLSFVAVLIIISSSLFAQDVNKIKAQIEKMDKAYTQAMLDKNLDKIMSMYTDDVISLPSYQPMVKGIEKIKELSEAQFKSDWKTTKFELIPTDVLVSGNLAIEVGNYDMTMSGPGVPEWADKGKYLTVWEIQKDGSLKIKIETWNTDTDPLQQVQSMQK